MQITDVPAWDNHRRFALLVLENRRELERLEWNFENYFQKKSEPKGSLFSKSNEITSTGSTPTATIGWLAPTWQ
jgi:hypothetical protein